MKKRKVILRADGGPGIGMGHFIRTLTLGEMLSDDFYCVYATKNPTGYQLEEIKKVCDEWIELPEDESHFETFLKFLKGDEIVVLDNYYFDTGYQRKIKEIGCKLVCIDDVHDKHYVADVVINHAPGLRRDNFSLENYTKLLTGPKYSLLRKDFFHDNKDEITEKKNFSKILIVFGGADFNNLTLKYLDRLYKAEFFTQISIITGDAYLHTNKLNTFIQKHNKININHYHNISANELINIVKKSEIAIAPASTILYELLSLNLPVVSGYYIGNQINIYKGFANLDVILKAGDLNQINDVLPIFKNLNKNKINFLLQNQSELFDGFAPDRIKKEFNRL